MSHGGGGGGGRGEVSSEPNLTPMLDLVLQLVMFFMLVTSFVQEDLSDKIKLPVAAQAKPLAAKDTNFIFLNVDKTGNVLVSSGEPKTSDAEILTYLRLQAKNHPLGEKEARDKVTVIIRADKEARFTHIHRTMLAVRKAEFRKLQLRAQVADK